jgi:hypothetical protein
MRIFSKKGIWRIVCELIIALLFSPLLACPASAALLSFIEGVVYDAETSQPISGAIVSIGVPQGISDEDGYYLFVAYEGTYTLTATAMGYEPYSLLGVNVIEAHRVEINIPMIYPENSDGNFTIEWSLASGATEYVLQMAIDVYFSSGNTVYIGTSTSYYESGLEDGTYYFRVKAINAYGESDWKIGQATNVDSENYVRKAIIVAGRVSESDNLWEITKDTCNWAFATLGFRQFNEDMITYLTNDTANVNRTGDATKANIEAAISAAQDADDLLIFMHDHGHNEKFWLDYYSNIFVSPADLDDWLDDIQPLEGTGPKVIVIIEACYSGSFVSQLQCEGQQERIIITSSKYNELSNMPNEGRLSFSRFFWNYTASSDTILTAFNKSTDDLNVCLQNPQHPQLDANGNGIPNEDPDDGDLVAGLYIGFQGVTAALRPHVGSVSLSEGADLHGSRSATIIAEYVVSADDIAHIWATIYPPGFTPDDPNYPIIDLPTIELLKNGDRYEGTYSNFRRSGIYTITVCAEDISGLVSDPKTITVRQERVSLAPILNLLLLSD